MNSIRVQMPLGTSGVSVAGQSYTPDEKGVVTVEHADHVAPLVESGGVELTEGDVLGNLSALMGSSTLPALIDIGEGREPIQLGQLVRDVFGSTLISVDEWNNLPERVRDILLGHGVAELSGALDTSALARAESLQAELDEALARLASIADISDAEPPVVTEKPDFASMTKARISEWVVANGGEELPAGSHASFVEAAEAHWNAKA